MGNGLPDANMYPFTIWFTLNIQNQTLPNFVGGEEPSSNASQLGKGARSHSAICWVTTLQYH